MAVVCGITAEGVFEGGYHAVFMSPVDALLDYASVCEETPGFV